MNINLHKPVERFLELDALRGLAVIGVLAYHYTSFCTLVYHQPTLFLFPLGSLGVNLFFIISGFVIFMTLEKTARPLDFVVSRFSRLYPSYWAALILTFTVVTCFKLNIPDREVNVQQAVINLSMLQAFLNVPPVDGVYWTLQLELFFYFVMFLLFSLKLFQYMEHICLGWLFLMLWHEPHLFHRLSLIPGNLYLLQYAHFFIAGIFFYNLRTKGDALHRHVGIAMCFLVQNTVIRDMDAINAAACFFFIFYLFVYKKLGWISQKPLLFLGTISYSLYLVHCYIGLVIIHHLYAVQAPSWVCFFVPALCSILIASAITFAIEKPSMELIRKAYKAWETPARRL